jgi:hypothetical protein
MATITTELIEPKRDAVGRKIVSDEAWEALIASYGESGMTQKAFAEREGVKCSTFTSWMQGRRRESAVTGRARRKGVRFAEVPLSSVTGLSAMLEVRLTDGTLVRGSIAAEVAVLVKALKD